MKVPEKIFVAGHRGMVGSAIVRTLLAQGVSKDHILTRTHAELDRCNQAAVQAFFAAERPSQVYLAAAKVGGIHTNNTYPADFIYDNLMVQANVIHAAHTFGVQKLLFLGSSCIYPRLAPQPMGESALPTSARVSVRRRHGQRQRVCHESAAGVRRFCTKHPVAQYR
jgi:GDP-L-fucose synthase